MKKLFFATAFTLGTFAFSACDSGQKSGDTTETVIESDTTEVEVEEKTVETEVDTNTTTREIDMDSSSN